MEVNLQWKMMNLGSTYTMKTAGMAIMTIPTTTISIMPLHSNNMERHKIMSDIKILTAILSTNMYMMRIADMAMIHIVIIMSFGNKRNELDTINENIQAYKILLEC